MFYRNKYTYQLAENLILNKTIAKKIEPKIIVDVFRANTICDFF